MNTKNLEELNLWASSLTIEQIKGLSEEEILSVAMERPRHPGQYGFMLHPSYFKSDEHFGQVTVALMKRLDEVPNLKDKMNARNPNQVTTS